MIVCNCCLDTVLNYNWHRHPKGYYRTVIESKRWWLHHFILYLHDVSIPEGYQVDHIDRNKENNHIDNLRIVTRRQNMINVGITSANTTGYKGVHYNKRDNLYYAQISVNDKKIYLGIFKDSLSAAIAYNNAAIHYHGEYAVLNDIE